MSSPAPSGRSSSISELLETSTRLFRHTLMKCLPLATLAVLCSYVPNLYWIASGHSLERMLPSDAAYWPTLPSDATYWLLYAIGIVMMLYLFSAVMLQQRSLAAGASFGVLALLGTAARRLPVLLVTWVLAQLSVLVGLSLLVLPGVFLLVCYVVLAPVVLFEQHNPYLALVRCVLLMRPYWWKMVAALVIAVLVGFVCAIVVAAMINILASVLAAAGPGPVFQAVVATESIAVGGLLLAFLSALALTFHSAAAHSAAASSSA